MPVVKVGDVVKGKVTGIEDYGFFLLTEDDYTGLVHISEISDKFVRNVNDYVHLDEEIYAKVIEYNENEKKLRLSIKNLDYRIEDRYNLDDENGFNPLKEQLPIWIEEYKNKED